MRPRTPIVAAAVATLALSVPATSLARHGADDPAGQERHHAGAHHRHVDDDRGGRRAEGRRSRSDYHGRHGRHHRHESGDDRGRRHGGHGADD